MGHSSYRQVQYLVPGLTYAWWSAVWISVRTFVLAQLRHEVAAVVQYSAGAIGFYVDDAPCVIFTAHAKIQADRHYAWTVDAGADKSFIRASIACGVEAYTRVFGVEATQVFGQAA